MRSVGLIDFMTQTGKVTVHEQGTLSDKRYDELKSAQKMIKNYVKDTNCRVDIYDANTVPKDKFVYMKRPDCVFIEVTDLLRDTTKTDEFYDAYGKKPVLKQIFEFIDKTCGAEESPIEKMKRATLSKYNLYLRKAAKNISKNVIK